MNTARRDTTVDKPTVVLICHANDPIDCEGIAAWLACSFSLVGIVLLQDSSGSLWHKLRQEYRRIGWFRLLDVILFRLVYRLLHASVDTAWVQHKVNELRLRYPSQPALVPHLMAFDPNSDAVRDFIADLQPEFMLARCKHILQKKIFGIPRFGTYALHPGICPLYRNAHGCFWALVNRDLAHVGMTLLKVDSGIDTGPVYLQTSCAYDETTESHIVIQHRVVLENLDAITRVLHGISNHSVLPKPIVLRRSFNWGQPWLTAYLHWKWHARRVAA